MRWREGRTEGPVVMRMGFDGRVSRQAHEQNSASGPPQQRLLSEVLLQAAVSGSNKKLP